MLNNPLTRNMLTSENEANFANIVHRILLEERTLEVQHRLEDQSVGRGNDLLYLHR